MRRLPLLLLLALAALGAWWLLGRSPAPTPVGEEPVDAGHGGGLDAPAAAPAPGGTGRGTATTPPRRVPQPSPSGPVAVGALRVRLAGPDRPVESSAVRLDADPLPPTPASDRLAVPQDDGTWLYERLPAGRYRVRATVAGYQTAFLETEVVRDGEATVQIPLVPGAEIAWKVTFPGTDAPEAVQVLLLDGRGVRQPASFQTPATTLYVPADRTVALPLEGRIVGLKPGLYRVRAVSPAGETDEQDADARAGAPAQVELRLRR